ncbi:MAG: HD domain-containing protein [Armatimonadota bacterium]|nr:HD domain-containing protein [Armatimonadota bacterium]MDR7451948.1 HD domain-containing protein [Armatimonadota bacterium]MDR7466630.1 HD domain-containing protein [Armatimonadota bacterium]MDR7492896.1 HD domain-containing protein [Armatimonadota bacterium]MDR7500423.1 HD domain-containing protein [Armatimonadota bacterium]
MTAALAADLAGLLYAAIQQVRHYGPEHPAAEESIRRFETVVGEALRQAASVRWEVSSDWLVVQGVVLRDDDRHALPLRAHLTARRIARLVIGPQVSGDGLRLLLRLLAREPEELIAIGGLPQALREAGVAGVETAGPDAGPGAPPDVYREAVQVAVALTEAVEAGNQVDIGRVRLAVEPLAAEEGDLAPLWAQVAQRDHDELDPQHAVNAAFLAVHLGRGFGLPRSEQIDLGVAAFVHDIGMARLPWAIRLAERTLRVSEPIPAHAVEGAMLLRRLGGRAGLPMLTAYEHHRVIAGDAAGCSPHAAVVALADYVDAATCGRTAERRRYSLAKVLEALGAGRPGGFTPVHVRVLAVLLAGAEAAGADFGGAG